MPIGAAGAMHVPLIDSLPGLLPGAMSGQPSNFNPLSRRKPRGASLAGGIGGGFGGSFGSFGGSQSSACPEPVEGGILMLADIEESHASRAALVSAWRDYGQQLVAASIPAASSSRYAGMRCDGSSREGASAPSAAANKSGGGGGRRHAGASDPSGARAAAEHDDGSSFRHRAAPHHYAPSNGGKHSRRALPSEGDSGQHEPRGGNALLDDAVSMLSTAAGPSSSAAAGAPPLEPSGGAAKGGAAGVPSDARRGEAAQVKTEAHDGGAPGEAEADFDEEEEDESSGWIDVGSGLALRDIRDDAVRYAVKSEMASGSVTQHLISQQIAVSQPLLCTWLGGKAKGSSGKASRNSVKHKLLGWLTKRGVPLSAALAISPAPAAAAEGSASLPTNPLPSPMSAATPSNATHPGAKPEGGGGKGASSKPAARSASKGGTGAAAEAEGGSELRAEGKPEGGSKAKSGGSKAGTSKDSKSDDGAVRPLSSGKKSKGKIKLTPQHLYVAYVWYLKQREARGEGLVPGEEESFCLKCKDGGDMLYCDFSGCTKCYHVHCCNLKSVPEGIWECPRHRCVSCGAGPSQTDAHGKPREPDPPGSARHVLWPCRTCPRTYCEMCLPKDVTFAGAEIVCESCQDLLSADMSSLQRDLIKWKPDLFGREAPDA